MQYSKQGLTLTERFEGCDLNAYRDQVGVPTIGYGHTFEVFMGMTCTKEQAEAWLMSDIKLCEDFVNTHVIVVPLNQNQFDALVDFCFNLGCNALKCSSLLRLLNKSDFEAAAKEFEKWDHAGGNVVAGLFKRRVAEEILFKEEQDAS
jgi:lysozyme